MSRKILSRITGLPAFCALAPVVWMLSYGLSFQVTGAAVGRQSSTSGLVMGFAVMLAPIAGAIGLGVGFGVRWLIRRIFKPPFPRPVSITLRVAACLGLVLIAITNWHKAAEGIYAADRAATPRVIENAVQLRKLVGVSSSAAMTPARRVYDSLGKVNKPIAWGDDRVSLEPVLGALKVTFQSTGGSLRIPMPGIDYIILVDAIPASLGADNKSVLALLVTGRATGRRDLLAIISDMHDLIYLELLDRYWDFRSSPLATTSSPVGDTVLVGSDSRRLLAFSL